VASRQQAADVEKVVKKKLTHDPIFSDDFSDSDGNENDYEGGGLLPHSEYKTKRLVRRHFSAKNRNDAGACVHVRACVRAAARGEGRGGIEGVILCKIEAVVGVLLLLSVLSVGKHG
jgi:hypothetical protein